MTQKISVRGCPICRNRSVEFCILNSSPLSDSHPLADGYDVVACLACGFVYADTAAPQTAYDALYRNASKYQDAKTSTGGGESAWTPSGWRKPRNTISIGRGR